MRTKFQTKLKKATSGISLFMLLFSILNPFSSVFAISLNAIAELETQANVVAQSGSTAS
jgi:hypothetical protein